VVIERRRRLSRLPVVLAASLLAGSLVACGSRPDCSDMIERRSGYRLEPIPLAQAALVPVSAAQATDVAVRHGAGAGEVVDVCLGLLVEDDRFSAEILSSRPTYQVRLVGEDYRAYLVDAFDPSRVYYGMSTSTSSHFGPAP
jgi:hypothetical protein